MFIPAPSFNQAASFGPECEKVLIHLWVVIGVSDVPGMFINRIYNMGTPLIGAKGARFRVLELYPGLIPVCDTYSVTASYRKPRMLADS